MTNEQLTKRLGALVKENAEWAKRIEEMQLKLDEYEQEPPTIDAWRQKLYPELVKAAQDAVTAEVERLKGQVNALERQLDRPDPRILELESSNADLQLEVEEVGKKYFAVLVENEQLRGLVGVKGWRGVWARLVWMLKPRGMR